MTHECDGSVISKSECLLFLGLEQRWNLSNPLATVFQPRFDLVDNIDSDVKIFADDTSLFSVVHDEVITAQQLNRDLERVGLWAWQWKMEFNAKKTEEVIFSAKRVQLHHPSLFLGNTTE